MLPHFAPRRSKCTAAVSDSAALERLPNVIPPAAARRRALTVISARGGHHPSPDKPPATAHPVCGNRLCSDNPTPYRLPPEDTPAYRPPKGKHAARSSMSVLASSGRHPACRYVHTRLAAACRLRQSCRRNRGPVALPQSGCPVCRRQHPAALSNASPQTPPPPPRVVLAATSSGYVAVHARKTAVPYSQSIGL